MFKSTIQYTLKLKYFVTPFVNDPIGRRQNIRITIFRSASSSSCSSLPSSSPESSSPIRCQFHQHFTRTFFGRKVKFAAFLFLKFKKLIFFGARKLAEKLFFKWWWNWLQGSISPISCVHPFFILFFWAAFMHLLFRLC